MTVSLYYNSSDINRLDKSISSAITVSGTLREQCSVLEPTVLIEVDDVANVNYMHIPEFGRYYYVTGISSVRNNLWAVSGHVDVLMTYRSQIRGCSAVLARAEQEHLANLYLDDDRFTITCRRDFQLIDFPHRVTTGGQSFVLTVAGGT